MKSSAVLKILLACALPLTLSLKVLAGQPPQHVDPRHLERVVSDFLSRHAYEVTIKRVRTRSLIFGALADCRLAIMAEAPEGWSADALRTAQRKAGGNQDRIVFVYKGRLFAAQPTGATRMQDFWTRFRQRLGIATPWTPVLAVRTSPTCAVEKLPWSEVAAIPGA